jgi:hypothetical protein
MGTCRSEWTEQEKQMKETRYEYDEENKQRENNEENKNEKKTG